MPKFELFKTPRAQKEAAQLDDFEAAVNSVVINEDISDTESQERVADVTLAGSTRISAEQAQTTVPPVTSSTIEQSVPVAAEKFEVPTETLNEMAHLSGYRAEVPATKTPISLVEKEVEHELRNPKQLHVEDRTEDTHVAMKSADAPSALPTESTPVSEVVSIDTHISSTALEDIKVVLEEYPDIDELALVEYVQHTLFNTMDDIADKIAEEELMVKYCDHDDALAKKLIGIISKDRMVQMVHALQHAA